MITRRTVALGIALFALTGCIGPKNYHSNQSAFNYRFPGHHGYYSAGDLPMAFIEFKPDGTTYNQSQTDQALKLIGDLQGPGGAKGKPVVVVVFIHGWKNNASDGDGNVWGFQRMLNEVAAQPNTKGIPVIGIYIGWQGDSINFAKTLSFWSRQKAAEKMANGQVTDVLKKILKQTKGEEYKENSFAVLIGHSFGGVIMEHAAINILQQHIQPLIAKAGAELDVKPPADLMVMLNEAGPANSAKPFLDYLAANHIDYTGENGRRYPLLLSMTSVGDVATKLAMPAGRFLEGDARKNEEYYNPPDDFGQTSNRDYNLASAANLEALRSHEINSIDPSDVSTDPTVFDISCVDGKNYRVKPTGGANQTPYWVLSMPQAFVPDHSAVFRDPMIRVLEAFMERASPLPCGSTVRKEALALSRPTLKIKK